MRFYYTKTFIRIMSLINAVLNTALLICFLFLDNISENLDILLISAWFFCAVIWTWLFFFGYCSFKVYIDNSGAKFTRRKKTFSMPWEDIKNISLVMYKKSSNIDNSTIFFESIASDNDLAYYDASNYRKYNESFFGAQYQEKIIQEIRKYWDKPIESIYQVEGKGKLKNY